MCIQATGIVLITITSIFNWFVVGLIFLGIGTAMVYPTLLAVIGDVVNPAWRASVVGVYRLWCDMGYALGALLSGLITASFGVASAIRFVAGLTFVSGIIAAIRMKETHSRSI